MLLLTGPAGSGKSATVFALADHLNLDVKEWFNSVVESTQSMNSERYIKPGNSLQFLVIFLLARKFQIFVSPSSKEGALLCVHPPPRSSQWIQWSCRAEQHICQILFSFTDFVPVGGSAFESQGSQFADFLLRANRYPSLQMFNQHALQNRILLVEVRIKHKFSFLVIGILFFCCKQKYELLSSSCHVSDFRNIQMFSSRNQDSFTIFWGKSACNWWLKCPEVDFFVLVHKITNTCLFQEIQTTGPESHCICCQWQCRRGW